MKTWHIPAAIITLSNQDVKCVWDEGNSIAWYARIGDAVSFHIKPKDKESFFVSILSIEHEPPSGCEKKYTRRGWGVEDSKMAREIVASINAMFAYSASRGIEFDPSRPSVLDSEHEPCPNCSSGRPRLKYRIVEGDEGHIQCDWCGVAGPSSCGPYGGESYAWKLWDDFAKKVTSA